MKKQTKLLIPLLLAAFLLSTALSAQETKVTVRVEKDGQVVTDTSYRFDDADRARHAIKMMEIISGDSLIWITEGDHEGEHPHTKHVMIMKSDGGETFEILNDEEMKGEHEKKIKVIVSDGEEGEWNVIENEDEDVYIISGDDGEVEIKEIIKEQGEGEKVTVVVVKKEKSKKQ